jgi:uncharacterized protein YecE (DUF72 family)
MSVRLHPHFARETMQFHVGTSGYSYKEWQGSFYPAKLPAKDMLSYYAQHFATVEINNTFYRLPAESVVESWAQQVPESFRFVLKARQVITHFKRLNDAERETDDFLRVAAVLGERLGPLLFQLPPNFKKDVPRLDAFLKHLGKRAEVAFEFRNETWFDDETYDCLKAHATAMCTADAEELPNVDLVRTAKWGYVRLRDEGYADADLKKWADRIRKQKWDHAFVFFKHEDTGTGPPLANRFLELASS